MLLLLVPVVLCRVEATLYRQYPLSQSFWYLAVITRYAGFKISYCLCQIASCNENELTVC